MSSIKTPHSRLDEARAAKAELNQRTRLSLLSALNSASEGNTRNGGLAVITQYANMSDEEKSALGVTDQVMDRLVRNYPQHVRAELARLDERAELISLMRRSPHARCGLTPAANVLIMFSQLKRPRNVT